MGPREGGGEPQKAWGVLRRRHDRLRRPSRSHDSRSRPLGGRVPILELREIRGGSAPRCVPTPNAIRESESLAYGLQLLRKDENMSQDVAGDRDDLRAEYDF